VPDVYYSERALADLDRLLDFIAEHDPFAARRAAEVIVDAVRVPERHPLIGRAAHGELRELVISHGRTGYVALYRLLNRLLRVEVLALRHQREAGYAGLDMPRPK